MEEIGCAQYVTILVNRYTSIRSMRMTVYEVLAYLASGMTEAEVLADFPEPYAGRP